MSSNYFIIILINLIILIIISNFNDQKTSVDNGHTYCYNNILLFEDPN